MPQVFMKMAVELSKRSTCTERSVGCVITSPDFENVYSVGYNGGASGQVNKCDNIGIKCGCLHAEINALIKCYTKDEHKVAFITLMPCAMCAKAMVNSGFSRVYYKDSWQNSIGVEILRDAGIDCLQIDMGDEG